MTGTRPATRVAELSTRWLRDHMHEALTIYGLAMGYDAAVVAGRYGYARQHTERPGFRAVGEGDDAQPLLVLTSGAHRVDETTVAGLLGVPHLRRATPDFVRDATGQAIGGVAPVGHPAPIGTLVDIELARYERVWAAAGHPSAVFPTTYEELLRLTAGTAAEVGAGPFDAAIPGTVAS